MKYLMIVMAVLALLPLHARTTSTYNFEDSGNLVFWDDATYESVGPVAPVVFYDEFIEQATTPPTSAESGYPWIYLQQGGGTVAYGADGILGTLECKLTSDSTTQEAILYMGDQRVFRIGYPLQFEARVKMGDGLSNANARIFFGFTGDHGSAEVGTRIGFTLRYASATTATAWAECDDTSTDNSATTGTTITAGTYYIFRIDARDVTSIKYYINGALVKSGLAYGGTTTALVLQPYIKVYKSTGAYTGTVAIDYLRIWQSRS